MEDFLVALIAATLSFVLGMLMGAGLGANDREATIYKACETHEEFVMEVHGVPQTYSCVRTK